MCKQAKQGKVKVGLLGVVRYKGRLYIGGKSHGIGGA
jgi:hypothetical protein